MRRDAPGTPAAPVAGTRRRAPPMSTRAIAIAAEPRMRQPPRGERRPTSGWSHPVAGEDSIRSPTARHGRDPPDAWRNDVVDEGSPAPDFTLVSDKGETSRSEPPREAGRPLLLPQGRHARLHGAGLRGPRRLGRLREGRRRRARREPRRRGVARAFRDKFNLPFTLLSDPDRRPRRRMTSGSRRRTTARPRWASSARPS